MCLYDIDQHYIKIEKNEESSSTPEMLHILWNHYSSSTKLHPQQNISKI